MLLLDLSDFEDLDESYTNKQSITDAFDVFVDYLGVLDQSVFSHCFSSYTLVFPA